MCLLSLPAHKTGGFIHKCRNILQAALLRLIQQGSVDEVKGILERDKSFLKYQDPQNGHTLLHIAAEHGQVEIVRYLIQAGIITIVIGSVYSGTIGLAVNAKDTCGWTPLAIAAYNGFLEVVLEAHQAGGDLDVTIQPSNRNILHFLARHWYVEP